MNRSVEFVPFTPDLGYANAGLEQELWGEGWQEPDALGTGIAQGPVNLRLWEVTPAFSAPLAEEADGLRVLPGQCPHKADGSLKSEYAGCLAGRHGNAGSA